MRSRMIAFCLGIAVVSRFSDLPAVDPCWLVACAMALVHGMWGPCLVPRVAACLLLGVVWALAIGNARLSAILPGYLEGEDFWVTGLVTELPQSSERAQQFTFKVERSCFSLLPADCPADPRVFRSRQVLLNYYGAERVIPGQRWRLRVRLNQLHGFANPGGFDYEGWLFQRGFAAKGYVRENPFNDRLQDGFAPLSALRFALRERLLDVTTGLDQAGIILALVLGDREQISEEGWAIFTDTGTNHLIVISGLHVGFIALLCHWIASRAARLSTWLMLRFPAQKVGALAAIVGAIGYSLLAGFSLPTQRAVIMVSVFMSGQILGRQIAPSVSYCVALTLVLASNPFSVTSAGFWLSFGAVGTLLAVFSGVRRLRTLKPEPGDHSKSISHEAPADRLQQVWSALVPIWHRWVRPQWAVFVGMTVPLALWMQQISLLAPLSNIVAIPLVSLLVVPLSLFGAFVLWVHEGSGVFLLTLANSLLGLMMHGLQALIGNGLVLWQFSGVTWGAILAAMIGTCLLLLPSGWPDKWLATVLFLPLLFPMRTALAPGVAQVTVLDVGQGLAIVVRTASHVLVYDTGPRLSDSFDTGGAVVYPYLRSQGVRQIDLVIISHGDNDHAGGLPSLHALLPVERLMGSEPAGLPLADDQFQLCQTGQHWQWDDVKFEILHPLSPTPYQGNDSSCVLRIVAGMHSMLLSGDIESRAEAELLASRGERLHSDVLVAPHHGSRSSSTPALISAVSPQWVIYSAGYRSQFGHPAPQVVERYDEAGSRSLNTALSGAVTVTLGGAVLAPPEEYRKVRRRFWYARASLESRRLHGITIAD